MPGPEEGLRRGRFGLTTGEMKARFILAKTSLSPKHKMTIPTIFVTIFLIINSDQRKLRREYFCRMHSWPIHFEMCDKSLA